MGIWDYENLYINPLSGNPTKWSIALKQFVRGMFRRIVRVCLTILWGWLLKE